MTERILIYDDGCKYCSGSTNIAETISSEVVRVPLSDEKSQEFISSQFDDEVFTLILIDIDDNKVHLGEDALRIVNKDIIKSTSVSDLIASKYRQISEFTSFLENRSSDITEYSGTEELNDESHSIAKQILNSE